MNSHLNNFKFYNLPHEAENNLIRGLAISLRQEPSFLMLLTQELTGSLPEGATYAKDITEAFINGEWEVDIQVDCSVAEVGSGISRVIAVTLTTDVIDTSGFYGFDVEVSGKHITDLYLRFGQTAILIEAKPSADNCLEQVHGQAASLVKSEEETSETAAQQFKKMVVPVSITWGDVLQWMETVNELNRKTGKSSYLLTDFVSFVRSSYPNWLNVQPLSRISSKQGAYDKAAIQQIQNRLNQVFLLDKFKGQIVEYPDRKAIDVSEWGWASEIIPYVSTDEHNFGKEVFVQERTYALSIAFQIKISHFMGKLVTTMQFSEEDLQPSKKLYTEENWKWAGKRDRSDNDWAELASFFDEHFRSEYDWRGQCKWQERLVNSNRQYIFLSFGFEVFVRIPLEELKELDKQEEPERLGQFVEGVVQAFKELMT